MTAPELIFVPSKGPSDFIQGRAPRSKPRRSRTSETTARSDGNRRTRLSDKKSPSTSRRSPSSTASSLPPTIPNSSLMEYIAVTQFFYHYVSPSRTFCRLDLDYVSSVIDRATKRNILTEAIISLGVLTLPIPTRVSRAAASTRYARALRLTKQALCESMFATTDEALMAVILLGLYEVSI